MVRPARPARVPSSFSVSRGPSLPPSNFHDDDSSDPIVRELDVYLCGTSAPSSSLHLIQFPLRPSQNPHYSIPGPHPTACRYKPENGLLELDFDTTSATGPAEGGRRANRTFASSAVINRTNMAVGFVSQAGEDLTDGNASRNDRLYLLPLSNTFQLRPSFRHVDELEADDDDDDQTAADQARASAEEGKVNALALRRPENDRAAEIRRTSYAFHRNTLEGEVWRTLTAETDRDGQMAAAVRTAVEYSAPTGDGLAAAAGNAPGSGRYVKSLNYLPRSGQGPDGNDDGDDHGGDDYDGGVPPDVVPTAVVLAARATGLLQNRRAPIPFGILRGSLLPPPAPGPEGFRAGDAALLSALAACGTPVRGAFVLRSVLCGLSRRAQTTRDTMLWILQRDGYVERKRLRTSLDATGEKGGSGVSDEVLEDMLTCICSIDVENRRWNLRVEDLAWMEKLDMFYPDQMNDFKHWWDKKLASEEISDLLHEYDEA